MALGDGVLIHCMPLTNDAEESHATDVYLPTADHKNHISSYIKNILPWSKMRGAWF